MLSREERLPFSGQQLGQQRAEWSFTTRNLNTNNSCKNINSKTLRPIPPLFFLNCV
uniref:Uncharacterized protein n=1 Tax=Solanum tuberosum TaxID=4113 RepID=M1AKU9_SOLTU